MHFTSRPLSLRVLIAMICVAAAALPSQPQAQESVTAPITPADQDAGKESGLAIPRFVTLKSEEVNLRTGPGVRYPVRWVYRRQWLPVEIIDEFEHWRELRDQDGEKGWVHKSLLSSRKTGMIKPPVALLYARPSLDAPLVLRAQKNVILPIVQCTREWCQLQGESTRGWIIKSDLWGAYPDEEFD